MKSKPQPLTFPYPVSHLTRSPPSSAGRAHCAKPVWVACLVSMHMPAQAVRVLCRRAKSDCQSFVNNYFLLFFYYSPPFLCLALYAAQASRGSAVGSTTLSTPSPNGCTCLEVACMHTQQLISSGFNFLKRGEGRLTKQLCASPFFKIDLLSHTTAAHRNGCASVVLPHNLANRVLAPLVVAPSTRRSVVNCLLHVLLCLICHY